MNTAETIYQKNLDLYHQLIDNSNDGRFAMDSFHSAWHLLATGDKELFHDTLLQWNLSGKDVPDADEWESIKFHWKSIVISSSFQQNFHQQTPLTIAKIFSLLTTIDEIEPGHFKDGARFLTEKIFTLFDEESVQSENVYSAHVKRAMHIIHRSLKNSDLGLKMIAKKLNLSSPYLSKIFHDETGESITTYIHKKKIEASLEQLLYTTSSVKDIAKECGYTSATTFCRKFKEMKGLSPLKYRRTYTP